MKLSENQENPKRSNAESELALKELNYILEDLKQNLSDVRKLVLFLGKDSRKSWIRRFLEKVKAINIT